MLRFSGKDVLSAVYEWNEAVQKMLDYMEEHLEEDPSLLTISSQVGYSPTYCSCKFHEIVGMPLKRYMAGRRLYRAALDIRDTDARILDIALQYGYSSQEALTRAFSEAFGSAIIYLNFRIAVKMHKKQRKKCAKLTKN